MNAKLVSAFLAIVALSGCIVVRNPPPPAQPGNVTFTWSFAGMTCSQASQVKSVVVTIPGQTLQNAGVYPCLANNYPGIVLHDFAAGTYSFTLDAEGYSGEQIYTGSGTFTVDGDVRVTVDLTPVGGANSYAYLTWHFPALGANTNPSCADALVTNVSVSIDGATATLVPCASGRTTPGAQTAFLPAGTHTIDLFGYDNSGYLLYQAYSTLVTTAGAPVAADYLIDWAVGGATLAWTLSENSVIVTCAQAGITTVYVDFKDVSGNLVYGPYGDPRPCGSPIVYYDYLHEGTYKVLLSAAGTGSTYYDNWANPPSVAVVNGVFPATALNILMPRTQ